MGLGSRAKKLAGKWGLTEKFSIVGYIGTHGTPAHGLVNVLNAADLLANHSDIAFLFVGAGAEREDLANESHRTSPKKRCIHSGSAKREDARYLEPMRRRPCAFE